MNARIWFVLKLLWLVAIVTYLAFRVAYAIRAGDPGPYVAALLIGGAVLFLMERYGQKSAKAGNKSP